MHQKSNHFGRGQSMIIWFSTVAIQTETVLSVGLSNYWNEIYENYIYLHIKQARNEDVV